MSVPPGKILLFIPMYRCAPQIGRVLEKVYKYAAGVVAEVLVVDNRSPDGSLEAAEAAMGAAPPIPTRLVINDANYSLGGSHKVAFRHALDHGFTHVIALHGDDQADIRDFVPHLQAGEHVQADVMLGSRFMKGSRLYGYGTFRQFGNFVFNTLFTLCSGRLIRDMGSGLNLYGPTVLKEGDYAKAADDLTFHCYFLLTMCAKGRKLKYVPVNWHEEDQVSNARLFRQAAKILGVLVSYSFARKKFLEENHGAPGFRYTCQTVAEKGFRS